jgi:hypothetical protein
MIIVVPVRIHCLIRPIRVSADLSCTEAKNVLPVPLFIYTYIYLKHAPLQCNTTCSGDLVISIVPLTFSFMNIIFHSYLVCGIFGTVLSLLY